MFAYELRVYDDENDDENGTPIRRQSIIPHPSTNLLLLQFLWYAESSV